MTDESPTYSHPWWYEVYQSTQNLSEFWDIIFERYASQIAFYINDHPITYQSLAYQVKDLAKHTEHHNIMRIDGRAQNWLIQAITAWYANQTIMISDNLTQDLSPPKLSETPPPHAIFFTSGTTGQPKPVKRSTAFAFFEAASYINDIGYLDNCIAVSLIKPWFGAMTKHVLGCLCAGITQYFAIPLKTLMQKKLILYCTPSQLSLINKTSTQYDIISLTGEPITAMHINILYQLLKPEGFLLDAFGTSECGVIARRKITKKNLSTFDGSFIGKILPGKKVLIAEDSSIWVQLPDLTIIKTGDLGIVCNNQLHLLGRSSHIRKIHGQWINPTPMLNLLRTRDEIFHVEIAPQQANNSKLIVFVLTKIHMTPQDLQHWLMQHIQDLRLIPVLIMHHQPANLGRTGKMQIQHQLQHIDAHEINLANIMCKQILHSYESRKKFDRITLEHQGLSSIDILELISQLELELHCSINTPILKTDTPASIRSILNRPQQSYIRKIDNNNQNTHKQFICLGNAMLPIVNNFLSKADIIFTDIIYKQLAPFTFHQLAQTISNDIVILSKHSQQCWIIAYSINTLLAIEVYSILKQHHITIAGLVLIDPPDAKRKQDLKKKKWWLILRANIMLLALKTKFYKNWTRYQHELRKIAITTQQKRLVDTRLLVFSTKRGANLFYTHNKNKFEHILLNNHHHNDLVTTQSGITSWLNTAINFINNHSQPCN